jgi:hypothetical protein
MDFEIYQIQDDGTRVTIEASKLNEVLSAHNVVILVDHNKRKIYNFNGKEAKMRTRFIGARMAVEQIRCALGMAYNVQAVEEGEETQGFRDFLTEIACPGSSSRQSNPSNPSSTPPTPPVVKIYIDKDVAEPDKLRPKDRSLLGQSVEQSLPDIVKDTRKLGSSASRSAEASPSLTARRETNANVDSVIKQLGEVPTGYDVEAVIVNNDIYKYARIQSKVLGKEIEQTRLERIDSIDGVFTLDGEVKVVAASGKVLGIQVLSKQKAAPAKKPKESAE